MLAIVFFQDSRPILVELEAVENPPAHERITAVLKLSGYEETPASFVLLAAGQDVMIAEIETAALADLAAAADGVPDDAPEDRRKGLREVFAEELDAVGTWAPVVPSPLADLIEAAEAAAFPQDA
jgi:hypothetical protein